MAAYQFLQIDSESHYRSKGGGALTVLHLWTLVWVLLRIAVQKAVEIEIISATPKCTVSSRTAFPTIRPYCMRSGWIGVLRSARAAWVVIEIHPSPPTGVKTTHYITILSEVEVFNLHRDPAFR